MPEAIPIRKPVSVNAPEITATRRIYVLGFNRCGTRSLTTAFKLPASAACTGIATNSCWQSWATFVAMAA